MTVKHGFYRVGTNAERLAYPTANLWVGAQWNCADTGEIWVWGGSAWQKVATGVDLFSRGAVLLNPDGVAAVTLMVWRCGAECTLLKIFGYRVAGTGVEVNARRNGGPTTHLAANLSVADAGTWMDAGAVQDADYAPGDTMEVMVVAPAGNPTQVGVQLDFAPA